MPFSHDPATPSREPRSPTMAPLNSHASTSASIHSPASSQGSSASSLSAPSSSTSSSMPLEPPAPPPGFQPPVAQNPAALRQQEARQRAAMLEGLASPTSSLSYGSSDAGSSPTLSDRQFPSSPHSGAKSVLSSGDSTSSTGSSPAQEGWSPSDRTKASSPTAVSGLTPSSMTSSSASSSSSDLHRPLSPALSSSYASDRTVTPRSPSPPSLSLPPPAPPQHHQHPPLPPLSRGRPGVTQTYSIDHLSPSIFSAPPTPAAMSLPVRGVRSNSDAWDSVWPATSPNAIPHLPGGLAPLPPTLGSVGGLSRSEIAILSPSGSASSSGSSSSSTKISSLHRRTPSASSSAAFSAPPPSASFLASPPGPQQRPQSPPLHTISGEEPHAHLAHQQNHQFEQIAHTGSPKQAAETSTLPDVPSSTGPLGLLSPVRLEHLLQAIDQGKGDKLGSWESERGSPTDHRGRSFNATEKQSRSLVESARAGVGALAATPSASTIASRAEEKDSEGMNSRSSSSSTSRGCTAGSSGRDGSRSPPMRRPATLAFGSMTTGPSPVVSVSSSSPKLGSAGARRTPSPTSLASVPLGRSPSRSRSNSPTRKESPSYFPPTTSFPATPVASSLTLGSGSIIRPPPDAGLAPSPPLFADGSNSQLRSPRPRTAGLPAFLRDEGVDADSAANCSSGLIEQPASAHGSKTEILRSTPTSPPQGAAAGDELAAAPATRKAVTTEAPPEEDDIETGKLVSLPAAMIPRVIKSEPDKAGPEIALVDPREAVQRRRRERNAKRQLAMDLNHQEDDVEMDDHATTSTAGWSPTVVRLVDDDDTEIGGVTGDDPHAEVLSPQMISMAAAGEGQRAPENEAFESCALDPSHPDHGVSLCNSPESTEDAHLPHIPSPPPPHPVHPDAARRRLLQTASDEGVGEGLLLHQGESARGDLDPMGGEEGSLPRPQDMDLEDESLTTLERIFLLSKSEFAHHRVFISKVIGDWVEDVDPCETVEYVLPLLNSLGTDEDESVREALAPGLHKILWFFYSSCRLLTEEDEDPLQYEEAAADADSEQQQPTPTSSVAVTVTSEGLNVVRRPTVDELINLPVISGSASMTSPAISDAAPSTDSSGNTFGSAVTNSPADETPASTPASVTDTEETSFSPNDEEHPFGPTWRADAAAEGKNPEVPVHVARPAIGVQTFTPLIGSLLMSPSPVVCDSAKAAILGILARLRGKKLPGYDPWPEHHIPVGEQRTYAAQTGTHIHEVTPLTDEEKRTVEAELIQAIVIGMAKLDETQATYHDVGGDGDHESYFDDAAAHRAEDSYGEDGQHEDDEWPGTNGENGEAAGEGTTATLLALESSASDGSNWDHAYPSTRASDSYPQSPGDGQKSQAETSFDESEEVISTQQQPTEPTDYAQQLLLETALHHQGEMDSPSAPPIDYRSLDSSEAAWAAQEGEYSFGESQFRDELALEASHGRLLSMNLIASVLECGVLEGEEEVIAQFVHEVVRMREDESFAVRREAAAAMAELLKVATQEAVQEDLLPLFDVFAVDLSPHVRQAACLALPALARRLQPHSFRQERALAAIDAFFHDEMLEIHATALEVLGELIYVFHDDPDGPPDALIEHFLGSGKKDAPTSDVSAISEAGGGGARLSLFANGTGMISSADDDSDQRPLVCAFNFPAVALTVGREGWPGLREYYIQLTDSKQTRVRKSLAASLHELAKILGDEITRLDLVPFFRRCLADVDEVRERLWDNLHVFFESIKTETAWPLVHELGDLLVQGQMRSWRLRERLMLAIPSIVDSLIQASKGEYLVVNWLKVGLVDEVAAVRAAAILAVVPVYASTRRMDNVPARESLDNVLIDLCRAEGYRRRRTFVQCMDSFLDHKYDRDLIIARCIPQLVEVNEDPVVEVRIALARFVTRICGPEGLIPNLSDAPAGLITMVKSLRDDESFDIQALVQTWIFPNAEPPRRPLFGSHTSSSSQASRPFTRRSSSANSARSLSSIRSSTSSSSVSSSNANLSVPVASGDGVVETLQELPENPDDAISALQLENMPSPSRSPRVVPGFEIENFAFPEGTDRQDAQHAAAQIAAGNPDPFRQYFGDETGSAEKAETGGGALFKGGSLGQEMAGLRVKPPPSMDEQSVGSVSPGTPTLESSTASTPRAQGPPQSKGQIEGSYFPAS